MTGVYGLTRRTTEGSALGKMGSGEVAEWMNAAACNAAQTGSIPVLASNFPENPL